MSTVTTHVLDAARGCPAEGVPVRLERWSASTAGDAPPLLVAEARTDGDGRVRELGPEALDAGDYRIVFDTGSYFRRLGTTSFYPEVSIVFSVADASDHYHVPLLLSPFAFSTYRGS
jgi:5-hydroxyisourate hydrolase